MKKPIPFKEYNPKRFKDLYPGDLVYLVRTNGHYPMIHVYRYVRDEDVDLQYPTRHWKKFFLEDIEDDELNKTFPIWRCHRGEFPKDIYGYDSGSYSEKYSTYFRLMSDKRLAVNALEACVCRLRKKEYAAIKRLRERYHYLDKFNSLFKETRAYFEACEKVKERESKK